MPTAKSVIEARRAAGMTAARQVCRTCGEDAQGHVCAICELPERVTDPRNGRIKAMAVDQDHQTGAVRGLLCQNCNKGIGNLGDNPDRLIAAAAYLIAALGGDGEDG